MKKKLLLILMTMMLVLSLAACKDSNKKDNSSTTAESEDGEKKAKEVAAEFMDKMCDFDADGLLSYMAYDEGKAPTEDIDELKESFELYKSMLEMLKDTEEKGIKIDIELIMEHKFNGIKEMTDAEISDYKSKATNENITLDKIEKLYLYDGVITMEFKVNSVEVTDISKLGYTEEQIQQIEDEYNMTIDEYVKKTMEDSLSSSLGEDAMEMDADMYVGKYDGQWKIVELIDDEIDEEG